PNVTSPRTAFRPIGSTKSWRAAPTSWTPSRTEKSNWSSIPPMGPPPWRTASRCDAPPSCIKSRTTPLFQGPSRRRRVLRPTWRGTSRYARCRAISRVTPDGGPARVDGSLQRNTIAEPGNRAAVGNLFSAEDEGPMEKIPMTAAGYTVLETELKHCQQVERPRIIQQITDARSHGDLSENAEYHAAKEQQSLNEGRIAELEDKLARAEVIDVSKRSGDTIKFGATVTLVDEDTDKKTVWQIVGEPEADAKKGRISITSPLARALVGKKKGAQVEVVTPGGAKAYEVMKVEWR